jgi:hypothetical protein
MCCDCLEPKEDIVFNCADCGTAIVRNSREHDDCWTEDDEDWYCGDCKCDHMPNDDEEDEDGDFTDCEDCGYTHPCEDTCPNEATACHYQKWREDTCECCDKPYDHRNPHRQSEMCDCVQNDDGTLSRPAEDEEEAKTEKPKPTCDDCGRAIRDTENLDTCWTNDGIIFWCEYCREEYVEQYICERDGED